MLGEYYIDKNCQLSDSWPMAASKKRGAAGRPPKTGELLDEKIVTLCTKSEKEELEKELPGVGRRSLSDWTRHMFKTHPERKKR